LETPFRFSKIKCAVLYGLLETVTVLLVTDAGPEAKRLLHISGIEHRSTPLPLSPLNYFGHQNKSVALDQRPWPLPCVIPTWGWEGGCQVPNISFALISQALVHIYMTAGNLQQGRETTQQHTCCTSTPPPVPNKYRVFLQSPRPYITIRNVNLQEVRFFSKPPPRACGGEDHPTP
jgi:hypothetical protein